VVYFLFFFQAEDGIRDRNVTGVQTCALPISSPHPFEGSVGRRPLASGSGKSKWFAQVGLKQPLHTDQTAFRGFALSQDAFNVSRSEERRVGKECRSRWSRWWSEVKGAARVRP